MDYNELDIDRAFRAGRHVSDRRPPRHYVKRLKAIDPLYELFYNPYSQTWEVWRAHTYKQYPYVNVLEFPPYLELEEYFDFALMRLRRMKKREAPTIGEMKREWLYRLESKRRREKEETREAVEDTYDWLFWGKKHYPMG